MKEFIRRYHSGETIPARVFGAYDGGMRFFGETVFFDWKKDHATGQFGLDREVYWQKVKPEKPEKTPGEIHSERPVILKNGTTRLI